MPEPTENERPFWLAGKIFEVMDDCGADDFDQMAALIGSIIIIARMRRAKKKATLKLISDLWDEFSPAITTALDIFNEREAG